MRWIAVSAALLLVACNVKVKVGVLGPSIRAPGACYERGDDSRWALLAAPPEGSSTMLMLADRFSAKPLPNDAWLMDKNGVVMLCRAEPERGQAWEFELKNGAWQVRSGRRWNYATDAAAGA